MDGTSTYPIVIRPTTDTNLPWVDYSTLTAINTCPRWGIINSWHGKKLSKGVERVLPLEAGRAMHDVFACVRFFDLIDHINSTNDIRASFDILSRVHAYARKLFDTDACPDRWDQAFEYYNTPESKDTRVMQMCLSLLETSGFHDDVRDNRRTQSNLESAAIAYIQRYPLGRFIPVITDSLIGVEVPFDITLTKDGEHIRVIGRIDALCVDQMRPSDPTPEVHENKTGARIDTVWSSALDTSHQVSGYCVAATAILGIMVERAVMWGLQIPVPKSSSYSDGVMRYPTDRNKEMLSEWAAWVYHTLTILTVYKDDAINAPKYTHSCNRYFRACPLIPLCVETAEQRKHIFDNEMITDRWSPLDTELV